MVCLENVLKISLQEFLKMSWRHLEDVFKTSWRRLEDAMKRSWRRFKDVLKTSSKRLEDLLKTSWRRLEDIWPRQICWSWPRRLEDVLKASSEDVRLRRTYSSWSRRLEDVFIKANVCWESSNKFPRIINGEPLNFICCSLASTFMSSNNIFRPFKSKSEIMQNEYD